LQFGGSSKFGGYRQIYINYYSVLGSIMWNIGRIGFREQIITLQFGQITRFNWYANKLVTAMDMDRIPKNK
jgi:hypothetical protein